MSYYLSLISKKLISLKITSNSVPSVTKNDIPLTKPEKIANAFNKYSVNISSTIQTNFLEINFLNCFMI